MARGESFVTDKRVPSHLVLFMTSGASFDTLVQTAGRATYLRAGLLEQNGWVDENDDGVMRVLMPKQDFKVVKSYPQLINEVTKCVRGGKSLEELFSENSVLQGLKELDGFAESRRKFGDRRKHFTTDWMLGSEQEEDSTDAESLADCLQRLQLPKRNEILWFDFAAEQTWYECSVKDVRLERGSQPPFSAGNVEYLLVCTDKSVLSLDDWIKLDDGDSWKRRKEDIGVGHGIHEAWILQDLAKIRKVVQAALKSRPPQNRWVTTKGIEQMLLGYADSGRSLADLSGDDLRRCMSRDSFLPGAALQSLSECARPQIERRPYRQSSAPTAKVKSKKGEIGEIQNICTPPPVSRGPDIQLTDGTFQSASVFTKKPRAWAAHLLIVDWPLDTPLDEPVQYDEFVGSSKFSFDANSPTPEGLYEYCCIVGGGGRRDRSDSGFQPMAPAKAPEAVATSSQGSSSSSSHVQDSPGQQLSPRNASARHDAEELSVGTSGPRRSGRTHEKRARRSATPSPIRDLPSDETFIKKGDMRFLIATYGPQWQTLWELLSKSKCLAWNDLQELQ
eukprot:4971321-Prymnesium_polylepis.1